MGPVNGTLGIELDSHVIRGVRLGGRRVQVLETVWDPENPAEGVRMLRENFGCARRLALAVRLPLLFAKRVKLPPLSSAERRKVLRLEPQRFFPVRLEDLVVTVVNDDFAFAAREASLTAWVSALEQLGSVEVVEPGPVALARALSSVGVTDATVLLDDAEHGLGMVDIHGGSVRGARRLYGSLTEAASALAASNGALPATMYVVPWNADRLAMLAAQLPDVALQPLPGIRGVPAPFLSAYGAGLGAKHPVDAEFVPDDLGVRIAARQRRRLVMAALACAAGFVVLVTSIDLWRARAVRRLDDQMMILARRVAPALALQNELGSIDRQARAIAQIEARRPDPLRVLASLSKWLPDGAYVRSIRVAGAEWQVEGYAPQAADITQALGGAPEFRDVHFLSSTARVDVGERTYESFAVAFQFVPAP